jgi:hypothetical protein
MDALYALKSVLVPIVAITTPLFIVMACLQFAQRRQERLHQTIVGLIEKGLPVPPQLLDPAPRRPGMSPLMRALTLIGAGIGLVVFLYTLLGTGPYMPWAAGAIPLAIGLAQLLAIRLERRPVDPRPDAVTPRS